MTSNSGMPATCLSMAKMEAVNPACIGHRRVFQSWLHIRSLLLYTKTTVMGALTSGRVTVHFDERCFTVLASRWGTPGDSATCFPDIPTGRIARLPQPTRNELRAAPRGCKPIRYRGNPPCPALEVLVGGNLDASGIMVWSGICHAYDAKGLLTLARPPLGDLIRVSNL